MSSAFKSIASVAAPIAGSFFGPTGAAIGSAVGGAFTSRQASKQAQQGAQQASRVSAAQAAKGRRDISGALPATLSELQSGGTSAISQLQPIADTGGGAFQRQAALSGALGPQAQQQAFAEFQDSPEQAFVQGEAEQASIRNAAATGGVGGGRLQQELQRQAVGFGAQDISNRFQRLGQIAAPGVEAQTNISNILSSLGSRRAQARQSAGVGLANIAVGQAAPQADLALQASQAQQAGTLGIGSAVQQGVGALARQGVFGGRTPGFTQANPNAFSF